MGRSQEVVFNGLKKVRSRFPFSFKEIHSDNGTEFINWHLFRYTKKEKLGFSRSRPNKKNDNCFVEQKNWTHVKKFVGYFRYDTEEELQVLNGLYRNELRLYKNLFQPDRRVVDSDEVKEKLKQKLMKVYISLNPAQLKRSIDEKLNKIHMIYKHKNKTQNLDIRKKLKPAMVTFLIADQQPISVTQLYCLTRGAQDKGVKSSIDNSFELFLFFPAIFCSLFGTSLITNFFFVVLFVFVKVPEFFNVSRGSGFCCFVIFES